MNAGKGQKTCSEGGYCAYSSPFLTKTTGSGLACGFYAAGTKVYGPGRGKKQQSWTLVTKLGLYFLPPVYKSETSDVSVPLTDESPSASQLQVYNSTAVAGNNETLTKISTFTEGYALTTICPKAGQNMGYQSQEITTGKSVATTKTTAECISFVGDLHNALFRYHREHRIDIG